MAKTYDVIVVGGGPAGLMAAKTAARYGFTVLLVERKKNVAEIRRTCASMFILDPGFHGEFMQIAGEQILFPRNDFSVTYNGAWVDLTRSLRFSPSGATFTLGDGRTPFAMVVEKEVLVETLLNAVLDCGVDVQNQTMGLTVQNLNEGTEVQLKTPQGTREVKGKITIAADGVDSRIAASLGVNEGRKIYGKGKAVSYILEGVETPYPNAVIRFIGGKFGAFILPKPPKEKGAPVLYEVMARNKEFLNRLIQQSRYSPWFKKSQIVGQRACAITFYHPLTEPVIGRVMVIGDAACWQEVEIQGALMCGYRAAQAACQELETGSDALQQYTHFWNCAFEFCWPGVVERSMNFLRMHTTMFNEEELDYLFKLSGQDPVPGTVNHFRAGFHELTAYLRHLDQIRKDRPDMAKKLEQIQDTLKYA